MSADEKAIDDLIAEDLELTRKIDTLNKRIHAETALLRQEIRERVTEMQSELDNLYELRRERRRPIFEFWEKHNPDAVSVYFPRAMITMRNNRELVVRDETALLNALDRIGRLDLVEYVFKENEIARMIGSGELTGLGKNAVKVKDSIQVIILPKRGTDNGKT